MKKLKRLRAEKGLTVHSLAEATGVSPRTISELERGLRTPHGLTLAKLANGLGVDLDELEEPDAPKVSATPSRAEEAPEERRPTLEELRLLSAIDPFVTRVEDETRYLRQLAESGRVSRDIVDYATVGLEFTARSFVKLTEAATAEHWSVAETRFLERVYRDVAGPYHRAWTDLLEAHVGAFTRSFEDPAVESLWRRGDESKRQVEQAGEDALRAVS